MTFSLRSILIVIAVVGIWLGAVLSKSALAVELAAAATNLFLLLAVALAIWHPQPDQRKFWTGFCVLGLGNFFLAHYFSAYQNTSGRIAQAVAGDPQVQTQITWSAGYTDPGGSSLVYQPAMVGSGVVPAPNPFGGVGMFQPHYYLVSAAVAPIVSLLVACLGGWLTLWISREGGQRPIPSPGNNK